MGRLRTYQLFDTLKARAHLMKLNTEHLRHATPRLWTRIQEGDEEFCEDIDGKPWDEDGCHFYSIDATITPADPTAKWDPTALAVVPADYQPEDPIDVSGDLGGMHSAERFVNGRWVPLKEGDRRGAQRVRMLFAVNEGITAVKFANFTHYFGHVALPAPLPKAGSRF